MNLVHVQYVYKTIPCEPEDYKLIESGRITNQREVKIIPPVSRNEKGIA